MKKGKLQFAEFGTFDGCGWREHLNKFLSTITEEQLVTIKYFVTPRLTLPAERGVMIIYKK